MPDGGTVAFKAGSFVRSVSYVFVEGKKPGTRLTDEQQQRLLEGCAWMPAAVERWRSAAASTNHKPTVDESIDFLIRYFPESSPAWGKSVEVHTPGGGMVTFKAEKFVNNMYTNFIDGKKPGTQLSDKQKRRLMEGCAWMPSAVEGWRRAKPTVAERVECLLWYFPDTRPAGGTSVEVHTSDGGMVAFSADRFVSDISNEFVQGKKPSTKLDDEQKRRLLAGCAWMPEAVAAWRRTALKAAAAP